MRANEDPYSAALMQFPLNSMVDFTSLMPNANTISQQSHGQQHPGTHNRGDSHGMESMKFQNQTSRDQNQQQQPANVAPPPGFTNSAAYSMGAPQLSSLFMQAQYPPMPPYTPYMMPNVSNQGRHIYADDDSRKTYDKMSQQAKQAQATPPPTYHNQHNGGAGAYMQKQKHFNWNN